MQSLSNAALKVYYNIKKCTSKLLQNILFDCTKNTLFQSLNRNISPGVYSFKTNSILYYFEAIVWTRVLPQGQSAIIANQHNYVALKC